MEFVVFIVEDDEDDQELLQSIFDEIGCAKELRFFQSGSELLNQLDSSEITHLPDVIILDHQTPGMNGSESVGLLKRNSKYHTVAIAVYSSAMTETKKMHFLNLELMFVSQRALAWPK